MPVNPATEGAAPKAKPAKKKAAPKAADGE